MGNEWYCIVVYSELEKAQIPAVQCPSATNAGLQTVAAWGPEGDNIGGILQTTNYIFSKGSTDTWCIDFDDSDEDGRYRAPYNGFPFQGRVDNAPIQGYTMGDIPDTERGMFNKNHKTSVGDIIDGTSNTIAAGEAAGGESWPLCRYAGCTNPLADPADLTSSGLPVPAHATWVVYDVGGGGPGGGILDCSAPFGCTIDPLNKNPVTNNGSMTDDSGPTKMRRIDNRDCTSSLTAARNSLSGYTNSTQNFRSQHTGGGFFLRADGSVQFVSENIGLDLYRNTSTIAGRELNTIPGGLIE
jgi:hypothetical protein